MSDNVISLLAYKVVRAERIASERHDEVAEIVADHKPPRWDGMVSCDECGLVWRAHLPDGANVRRLQCSDCGAQKSREVTP